MKRTKNIRKGAYGGTLIGFDILPEKYIMKKILNRKRAAFGIPTDPTQVLAQNNLYRDQALAEASQVIDPITAGVNVFGKYTI